MSRNRKRLWSIFLTICMVMALLPATAVTASAAGGEPFAVVASSYKNFYANGTPITIMANGENTVIMYDSGYAKIDEEGTVTKVDNLADATDVSEYNIYGGNTDTGSNDNIESAKITMESGSVQNIYGGSTSTGDPVGSVTLTIKGGTVGNVTGTAKDVDDLDINISGNATIEAFYGAQGDVTVSDMDITISGTPIFSDLVYIGPSGTSAKVTNLLCTISGGTFNGNIYGGYVGNDGDGKIQLNSNIEIKSEKEFDTVDKATNGRKVAVEVASGVTITNYGTISWYNNAVNKGTIDNYGLIEECMINAEGGIINNYGTINGTYGNTSEHLTNNGTINNHDSGILAETINNEGTINYYDGGNNANATINNSGTFNNYTGETISGITVDGGTVKVFYPVELQMRENQNGDVSTGSDGVIGRGTDYAEKDKDYTVDLMDAEIEYAIPGGFKAENYKLSENIKVVVGDSGSELDKSKYKYDRTKGTLTIKASDISGELAIDAVLIPKTTLTATAPTFDEVTYGYAQPESKAITIANTGEGIAYIDSIALSGEGADAFTLGGTKPETLAVGASDSTSLTLQPKAGLVAGTYLAALIITYDNGKTATAEVEFTVNKKTQLAPPTPPQMTSSTADTITLTPMADNPISGAPVEYSIDHGKTWQTNNLFTGLDASTQYGFMARYAATDNYEASSATEMVNFTTKAVQISNGSEGKKTAKSDNSSATGDDSNMLPWIIAAATAAMVGAGTALGRRRRVGK